MLVQEAVHPKVKGDSMAQTLALTCIGKHLLVYIHAELEQLLDYQGSGAQQVNLGSIGVVEGAQGCAVVA